VIATSDQWRHYRAVVLLNRAESLPDMPASRLVVVDPGHFHATLVKQQMYPGLSPRGFTRRSAPTCSIT
jgi:hypothetical protein